MPQIRPIADIKNTNEISDFCHTKNEPLFIAKNGYTDLVIMSMEHYETMLDDNSIDCAITLAEAQYHIDGNLLDARESLSILQRKHFG